MEIGDRIAGKLIASNALTLSLVQRGFFCVKGYKSGIVVTAFITQHFRYQIFSFVYVFVNFGDSFAIH